MLDSVTACYAGKCVLSTVANKMNMILDSLQELHKVLMYTDLLSSEKGYEYSDEFISELESELKSVPSISDLLECKYTVTEAVIKEDASLFFQ